MFKAAQAGQEERLLELRQKELELKKAREDLDRSKAGDTPKDWRCQRHLETILEVVEGERNWDDREIDRNTQVKKHQDTIRQGINSRMRKECQAKRQTDSKKCVRGREVEYLII